MAHILLRMVLLGECPRISFLISLFPRSLSPYSLSWVSLPTSSLYVSSWSTRPMSSSCCSSFYKSVVSNLFPMDSSTSLGTWSNMVKRPANSPQSWGMWMNPTCLPYVCQMSVNIYIYTCFIQYTVITYIYIYYAHVFVIPRHQAFHGFVWPWPC